MTTLAVYRQNGTLHRVSKEVEPIANTLHGVGVLFERWEADRPLPAHSGQETILEAYRRSVDRLMQHYGFQSADVVSVSASHPDRLALRQKFLDEHTHSEFEVRFFVEGQGLFFIHAADHVYGILCQRGDLLSIPAGMPHWFDLGAEPVLKCIRLFTTPEGWVAEYTGSAIARSFPMLEAFVLQHG